MATSNPNMKSHELECAVLELDGPDRARILERLIQSFDGNPELDSAWADEAQRREHDVLEGKTSMVSGKDALARLRAEFD